MKCLVEDALKRYDQSLLGNPITSILCTRSTLCLLISNTVYFMDNQKCIKDSCIKTLVNKDESVSYLCLKPYRLLSLSGFLWVL